MREGVEKRASKRAPSPLFNSWSVTERERERERDGERENTVPPPPRLLFLPGVVVALQRSLCVKSEREFFCKKEGEIKGWAWEEASTRPLLQCRASVAAATIRPLLLSLSLSLSLSLNAQNSLCSRVPAASASCLLPERTRDGRQAPLGWRPRERLAWRRRFAASSF